MFPQRVSASCRSDRCLSSPTLTNRRSSLGPLAVAGDDKASLTAPRLSLHAISRFADRGKPLRCCRVPLVPSSANHHCTISRWIRSEAQRPLRRSQGIAPKIPATANKRRRARWVKAACPATRGRTRTTRPQRPGRTSSLSFCGRLGRSSRATAGWSGARACHVGSAKGRRPRPFPPAAGRPPRPPRRSASPPALVDGHQWGGLDRLDSLASQERQG